METMKPDLTVYLREMPNGSMPGHKRVRALLLAKKNGRVWWPDFEQKLKLTFDDKLTRIAYIGLNHEPDALGKHDLQEKEGEVSAFTATIKTFDAPADKPGKPIRTRLEEHTKLKESVLSLVMAFRFEGSLRRAAEIYL